jgi:hypothetical protein
VVDAVGYLKQRLLLMRSVPQRRWWLARMAVVGLAACLSAAAAWSQGAPAARSGPAAVEGNDTRLRFRLLFLGTAQELPADLFYIHRRQRVPLQINRVSRSPVYDYLGPVPIALYRGDPPELAASFTPPDGVREGLVLLSPRRTPGRAGEPQFDSFVLDDGLDRLPPGALRMVNLTGLAIAAQLQGEVFQIGPGPSQVFRLGRGNETADVTLRLAAPREGEMRIVHQANFKMPPDERAVLFLLPPRDPASAVVVQVRWLREKVTHPPPGRRG